MKYLLIVSVFLIRCGSIPQTDSVSSEKLLGEWVLENGSDAINYGKIEFKGDSTALFLSRGDTIYRFKFHVKSDNLYLTDILGKEESYKVISATDDQLTFSSLREKKEKQVYKRAE
jgi:hypothetical protein